jgi:hypothetical protein
MQTTGGRYHVTTGMRDFSRTGTAGGREKWKGIEASNPSQS